ncbi:hypothetical protein D3C85_1693730 [compost metagenome]
MVNHLVLYFAFWVDDEQAAKRDTFFFNQYAVVTSNALCDIGSKREFKLAKAIIVNRRVDPCTVAMFAVYADTKNFSVQFFEFSSCKAQSCDFCRAYKSEI